MSFLKRWKSNHRPRYIKLGNAGYNVAKEVLVYDLEPIEKFWIFCLDIKCRIIGIHLISIGSLNAAIVHPREVFKAAILNNAASIILLHNHPSGDTKPSKEDISLTKRLSDVGKMLQIEVVDHVVLGNNYCSMKTINVF